MKLSSQAVVDSFRKQAAGETEVNPDQLKAGIEVEREHKDLYDFLKSKYPDFDMTEDEFYGWIAKAHLREIESYYLPWLKEMEMSAKSVKSGVNEIMTGRLHQIL